ncbi:unnamed protein product [Adineta ricciae]|uniref:Uncharacterized protein n=1 Tax=Adineta ricciae TaxID=249248 RepID=A0A815TB82_ADIRI|nr:unnamed protein product [Adineta ricciae]
MTKINLLREYEAERKLQNSKDKTNSKKVTDDKDNNDDDYAAQDMLISMYAHWKLLVKRCIDNIALTLRAACVFDTCSGISDRLRKFLAE